MLVRDYSKIWVETGVHMCGKMTSSVPNLVLVETLESSAEKVDLIQKRKLIEGAKEHHRQSKYSCTDNSFAACTAYSRHDGDITPSEVTDDIIPQHLQELKDSFYSTKERLTTEEASKLQEKPKSKLKVKCGSEKE